jgi:hypothetical protein
MVSDHLCPPSVILEWETVQQGGISRVQLGLREFSRQFAELQGSLEGQPELIICYDPAVIVEEELRNLLEYLNFLALVNQYAPIILISSQEIDPVLVLASGAIFKALCSDRKIFEQI